jgi:hypothetical protein
MINSACCEGLPARSAKIFRLNCDVRGAVLIVKFALVAPAGTVTLEGIVATLEDTPLEIDTTVGPVCVLLNVTVPVAELPPTTLVGFTDRSASNGAGGDLRTVMTSLKLYRPSETVTVTSVSAGGSRVSKNN